MTQRHLRLLSWNIQVQRFPGRWSAVADAILGERPDLLLLQEVPWRGDSRESFLARLADGGLPHFVYGRDDSSRYDDRKSYGSLIASRFPLEGNPRWASKLRYPEVFARATLTLGRRNIDVFSAHIPNGAGNGWRKIDHVLELGSELVRAHDDPRIVCGDFNEPKSWQSNGRLVPFAYGRGADGGEPMYPHEPWASRRRPEDSRELAWWDYGVRSVLDGERIHGLRHVYHDRHGYAVTPVTHTTTRGNPRFFDHGFVSRHLKVTDSGYHHHWRTEGLSDHSALWADLELLPEAKLPPLMRWSE